MKKLIAAHGVCYTLQIISYKTKNQNMNIKNYTLSVEATRSMVKIEELLVEIGASNINKQYAEKICVGIPFLLYDPHLQQTLPYHLKAQVEVCFNILWHDVKRPGLIQNLLFKCKPAVPPGKSFATG